MGQLNSNTDRLPSLQRICQETVDTVIYSASSKSPSPPESMSIEESVDPINDNAILSILNSSSGVTCITGNAELNINHAEREFQIEDTLIDNTNMRRRMSTLSNRIELQFKGIRMKLINKSDHETYTEDSEETFENRQSSESSQNSFKKTRQEKHNLLQQSPSKKTRAAHESPIEVISTRSSFTRLVHMH